MKDRMVGIFSLIGLAGAYLVLRYPLFSFHGMKEWPFNLFLLGTGVIAVCGLVFRRKVPPIFTLIGYVSGFISGCIFQFDYGHGLNSLWIIWTCVYLAMILVGIALDFFFQKQKNK